MKKIISSVFIVMHLLVLGQGQWEEKWRIPSDIFTVWDIDQASNSIICSQNNVTKRDINGKIVSEQSVKSIGALTKIDASTIFKLALFSENQQQICFLDNALALQNDCIDLATFDIQYAQTFCYTAQNDRLWVYDQLNSSIRLITLKTMEQQIIQNLRSLIQFNAISQLFEWNNELFLVDDAGKVHHFDLFGSFIGTYTLPTARWVQPWKEGFLVTDEKDINFFDPNLIETISFFKNLPVSDAIISFKWQASTQLLFVQTTKEISCFHFKK